MATPVFTEETPLEVLPPGSIETIEAVRRRRRSWSPSRPPTRSRARSWSASASPRRAPSATSRSRRSRQSPRRRRGSPSSRAPTRRKKADFAPAGRGLQRQPAAQRVGDLVRPLERAEVPAGRDHHEAGARDGACHLLRPRPRDDAVVVPGQHQRRAGDRGEQPRANPAATGSSPAAPRTRPARPRGPSRRSPPRGCRRSPASSRRGRSRPSR